MNALSDVDVKAIADAIFNGCSPTVLEADSAFGKEPCKLQSPQDFCIYASNKRHSQGSSVHFAVHYPDLAGRLQLTRVSLDPSKCDGHTYRYTAEGWGLIRVYVQLGSTAGPESFVSANSEKRAHAWAATYPELDPPSSWDWPAVTRHLRRLRRVLKLAA